MGGVSTILFDWGRTLHDPDTDDLFPGVREMLERLKGEYHLVLFSLAKSDTPELRLRTIQESGVYDFFAKVYVGGDDKNAMYEAALSDLHLIPAECLVVDDRTTRGIAWGNKVGAKTIWLKRGKFANENPDQITGEPTHTITSITDLELLLA